MGSARPVAVFGHRGARGLAPENTLGGFALVHRLGLTGVEFDIALTADGIPVVHHDPRLNPAFARDATGQYVDDGAPLLRALSYAEAARYDVGRLRVGTEYAARYPQQVAQDGARIPTLAAALAALGGRDLLIEIKTFPDQPEITAPPEAMAAAAIEVLRAHDAIGRTVLFAFDWRVLRAASILEPALRRCCLTEPDTIAPDTVTGSSLWLDGIDLGAFDGKVPRAVASTGAACWAPFHAVLEQAEVAEAQALGLLVVPWTVNTPEALDRMIGLGVDGVISDRPDLACAAVERHGRKVAPPGFVAAIAR